jgi:diguanylate cyclase (GGDEF)-like protein
VGLELVPETLINDFPIPANERERLEAVRRYDLFDTPPEVQFDVTTRVAARLFNAPIALVALMDQNRLWFKSKYGLELKELERKIAFCSYAIMAPDELLVVEDLRRDPRFVDNPLVSGPVGLRFYAGCPLLDETGLPLGTLAILDTKPRTLGPEDRSILRDLSQSVMTALEGRSRAIQLALLATTDSLTGLGNRMQFQTALSLTLKAAAQTASKVAVLYLDLDGFKEINDRLGHGAGDEVLREVARRLQPLIRSGEHLARLGGDEFAIVVRDDEESDDATTLAERIVKALRPPMILPGGEQTRVAVSIGISVRAAADADVKTLLAEADLALYRAKTQAVLPWCVFGDPDPSTLPETRAVVMSRAPSRQSPDTCGHCSEGTQMPFPFTMAFQPILRASTRTIFAYEALVRGPTGEGAASILARVTRRNRYAFDQSCRRTAIELSVRLGILATGANLSINFIPGAMYEPENCVRATLAAARRAAFPAEKLIFEVTEGEEVLDAGHLMKIFKVYRRHGFMPAIDDFGAGYSGLNLLAGFQPAIIKLDRQLIEEIHLSLPKQAIVRGVLSVCRDLNILPIAEGVEEIEEYLALRELGIDVFQGYLFAHPGFEALPVPVYPD